MNAAVRRREPAIEQFDLPGQVLEFGLEDREEVSGASLTCPDCPGRAALASPGRIGVRKPFTPMRGTLTGWQLRDP